MKNTKFYRLLHARGLDTQFLADVIDSGRGHVTEVLNNKPGRGGKTRRKLFLWLLPAEIDALGWNDEYDAWLRVRALRKEAQDIEHEENLRAGADMRSEENSEGTSAAVRRQCGEGNKTGQPVPCST